GTAPTVVVSPVRGSDFNGWYNHAVKFSAAASAKGPSGAGSCGADSTYSTPDSATASLTLHCTDGAGNDGSDTAHFQYDGTAPTVVVSPARSLHVALPIYHAVKFSAAASANGPSGA